MKVENGDRCRRTWRATVRNGKRVKWRHWSATMFGHVGLIDQILAELRKQDEGCAEEDKPCDFKFYFVLLATSEDGGMSELLNLSRSLLQRQARTDPEANNDGVTCWEKHVQDYEACTSNEIGEEVIHRQV